MKSSALAVLMFALVGFVAGQLPTYPTQYMMMGTMSLPYASIVEPVTVYFDGDNGMQKTEYYNGMDKYIFRSDISTMWQVNPVVNQLQCFANTGSPVSLQSYLPDISNFTQVSGSSIINGIPCTAYQLVQVEGEKTNTYTLYVNAQAPDFTPVRYHMQGYDSLLGSHYDEYVLDYHYFKGGNSTFTAATFAQPLPNCGGMDAGAFFVNPLVQVSEMMNPSTRELVPGLHPKFQQYQAKYGKSYKSVRETIKRQNIFLNRLRYIESNNRKNSYKMAMNHLGDLTSDELNVRRGIIPGKKYDRSNNGAQYTHELTGASRPASFDWHQKGAVTPVQDQGICGSCWSFGSTGCIEGAYAIKYGKLEVFAQQELMDCSWPYQNNACDGGLDYQAYQWIMNNGGIAFNRHYGSGSYLMADGFCQSNSAPRDANIASYVNITSGDEEAVLDAIANVGPVSVAIDASHDSLSFYASGVYVEPACKNGINDLDHAVLAVGYGTENGQDYWLVKNSWSTHWGDNGYVKMARANNQCGVATSATYVTLV